MLLIYDFHFYRRSTRRCIKTSDRHYVKREYAGNHAAFGTGVMFLFIGTISLILRTMNVDFIGLSSWGFWLFIPAFFILIGAVGQLSTDRRIRQDVEAAMRQRGSGRFLLDEIAADAGVKRRFLLRVLMDLRTMGHLTYRYDDQTGEIIVGEQVLYQQAPEYLPLSNRKEPATIQAVQKERLYCIFCGQIFEPNIEIKYCPNCGSQIL